MRLQNRRTHRKQRGVAMFMALFALMLLSAVAFAMMFVADTETNINLNTRTAQVAYYAARAGLEEGRVRLLPAQGFSIPQPPALPAVGAPNVVYLLNPDNNDTVEPWNPRNVFFDTQLCNARFQAFIDAGVQPTGVGTPCVSAPTGNAWYQVRASLAPGTGTAAAIPYKWVRVTRKSNLSASIDGVANVVRPGGSNSIPVCWNGSRQILLPAGFTDCEMDPPPTGQSYLKAVYQVTALAVTENNSRRIAQMEVASPPPFITNSAVASEASVVLQGSHTIDGYDSCSCQCVGSGSSMTCVDKPGRTCLRDKYAVYSNGNVQTNGSSGSVSAGTTPTKMENAPWPYDIPDLISQYRSRGVVSPPWVGECTTSGSPPVTSCGTRSNQVFGTYPTGLPNTPTGSVPQNTYVPGNVRLTAGATGSGTLIIDGDLDISGGLNWYGLIIVRGRLTFTGGAGSNVNIFGSILAGENVQAQDTVIGGSVNLRYDLCALRQMDNSTPPTMISSREIAY